MIYPDGTLSPASKALDEAVELALEDQSPYPHRAAFLDTDRSDLEWQIDNAFEEGHAAVLVSPDGSFQVLPAPDPRDAPGFA